MNYLFRYLIYNCGIDIIFCYGDIDFRVYIFNNVRKID